MKGATPDWNEIVGVVGNVKTYSEDTRDDPEVYEPFLQRPLPSFSLMLRANSDPNGVSSALRNAVAQVDAELPLARVMSMPAFIERQRGGDPLFLRILGTFALLALILAAIGIYGHLRGPWLYFIVPIVISVVAVLATHIPARRAMRVDPMVALRYE